MVPTEEVKRLIKEHETQAAKLEQHATSPYSTSLNPKDLLDLARTERAKASNIRKHCKITD